MVSPDNASEPTPFTPWKTVGISIAILLTSVVMQSLAVVAIGLASGRAEPFAVGPAMKANGTLFSVAMLVASIVGIAAIVWVLRHRSPRRYLALIAPQPRSLVGWLAATVALMFVVDAITLLRRRDVVPPEWFETLRTAGSVPLLALALVVAAPVFEEMFFRGFLFRGLAVTRLRPVGTIAVTSVIFALAHFPGDVAGLLSVLASAVLLASARYYSGSLVTSIAMHALGNAKAIVHVLIALRMQQH